MILSFFWVFINWIGRLMNKQSFPSTSLEGIEVSGKLEVFLFCFNLLYRNYLRILGRIVAQLFIPNWLQKKEMVIRWKKNSLRLLILLWYFIFWMSRGQHYSGDGPTKIPEMRWRNTFLNNRSVEVDYHWGGFYYTISSVDMKVRKFLFT